LRLEFKDELQLTQEQEQPCILLVDDEPIIRELCSKVLDGYRVIQAGSGEEALQIIGREPVDVVLTDVMMPVMSGLDLLQAVKERKPTQAVVVMTGFADKETILQALKADADDFITKPINLLQLRTTIAKVLERKALKEELVQLRRMDRLKSDFLGLVSHKLKTPITAISLFIQNLASGIGDPRDPSFAKTLDLILGESNYLGYLVQDLLYYSEIILQEGPPRLAPVSLRDMVMEVASAVRETADANGVALALEVGEASPTLQLDRERVAFALRALLENAVKLSPPDRTVSLDAEVSDDAVTLRVRDQGQGIPREELPKVFEKFYQVDPSHTGQVRGFGLGLFYARQFIQSHGGSLHLESTPGTGTTATLTLPRH